MQILTARHSTEDEIKKSRFLATAAPVESAEQALALLPELKDPKATHNTWAFKVGEVHRFSDDGEPGGTAGRPILSAIEQVGIDRVLVMVTRHFGGIKLGSGGLVRAYGGAAARCLREAPRVTLVPHALLEVPVPFDLVGVAHRAMERYGGSRQSETHTAEGTLLSILVAVESEAGLVRGLLDLSAGRLRVTGRSEILRPSRS
jgi:putative IMPACT (imprinted ancient) family translation regulator